MTRSRFETQVEKWHLYRANALIEGDSYDPLGNRTSKTDGVATNAYVYDAANQLTEIHQDNPTGPLLANLGYDLNGSLISKNDAVSPMTLTYDALNRLIQVDKTGQPTQNYLYDDHGRRIKKSVGGAVTQYLYNGRNIVSEYGAVWTAATATYTHGPGLDAPLIQATAGTINYYHQDGLGSVVAVSDQTGATTGTAGYDAWGNALTGSGAIPRYGYTGREPDETGLIYYRTRYYDPMIGRFIQKDPIGMNGGMNLYAYAGDNPISLVDPNGQLAFFWHFTITAAAAYKSGAGIIDSIKIGYEAAAVDFQAGSQGTSSDNTDIHAMSGVTEEGVYQTESQTLDAIQSGINEEIQTGDLADAAHTAVDMATPDHFLQEWQGFAADLNTAEHILSDIFPSLDTISQAYNNSLELMQAAETLQTLEVTPNGELVPYSGSQEEGVDTRATK